MKIKSFNIKNNFSFQIQQQWGFKLKHKKNKVNDLDLRVKKNFFPQQFLSERVGANASRIKDGHKSRFLLGWW